MKPYLPFLLFTSSSQALFVLPHPGTATYRYNLLLNHLSNNGISSSSKGFNTIPSLSNISLLKSFSCLFNPIPFHIYKESFAVQLHLCFTIFIKIAGVIIYKRNNLFPV